MHHLCQAADILWRSFLRSQQSWEFLHRCVLPRKVSIKINFFFIYNKNNKKTSLPVHHLCRAADILWRSFLRSQRCWVFPPRCVLPRKVSIKINFFLFIKKRTTKKARLPVHRLCRAADILWRSFLRSQRCWAFPPRCFLPPAGAQSCPQTTASELCPSPASAASSCWSWQKRPPSASAWSPRPRSNTCKIKHNTHYAHYQ